MLAQPPTFDEVWRTGRWEPLRNCPGRYRLLLAESKNPLCQLLGESVRIDEYRIYTARDVVLVAELLDGGMISYRRADGTYLHTLNTAAGFDRKLRQLGILR